VSHAARPPHEGRHPVHVTLRAAPGLPSLRRGSLYPAIRGAIAAATRGAFRVAEFSVQSSHVHLIVEAAHRRALARGVQGLAIRRARAVNRAAGRAGRVWVDRYHARALRTPAEVWRALVYVLQNWRKHRPESQGIDPCSSGPWFRGWARPMARPLGSSPVARATTWLLAVGWRRYGAIDADARPGHRPAHRRC
jgi:REP element-mobilizing transposase RayT